MTKERLEELKRLYSERPQVLEITSALEDAQLNLEANRSDYSISLGVLRTSLEQTDEENSRLRAELEQAWYDGDIAHSEWHRLAGENAKLKAQLGEVV